MHESYPNLRGAAHRMRDAAGRVLVTPPSHFRRRRNESDYEETKHSRPVPLPAPVQVPKAQMKLRLPPPSSDSLLYAWGIGGWVCSFFLLVLDHSMAAWIIWILFGISFGVTRYQKSKKKDKPSSPPLEPPVRRANIERSRSTSPYRDLQYAADPYRMAPVAASVLRESSVSREPCLGSRRQLAIGDSLSGERPPYAHGLLGPARNDYRTPLPPMEPTPLSEFEVELPPEAEAKVAPQETKERKDVPAKHMTCVICKERELEMACLPCGHAVMCALCERELSEDAKRARRPLRCPICRKNVDRFQKVYWPE